MPIHRADVLCCTAWQNCISFGIFNWTPIMTNVMIYHNITCIFKSVNSKLIIVVLSVIWRKLTIYICKYYTGQAAQRLPYSTWPQASVTSMSVKIQVFTQLYCPNLYAALKMNQKSSKSIGQVPSSMNETSPVNAPSSAICSSDVFNWRQNL